VRKLLKKLGKALGVAYFALSMLVWAWFFAGSVTRYVETAAATGNWWEPQAAEKLTISLVGGAFHSPLPSLLLPPVKLKLFLAKLLLALTIAFAASALALASATLLAGGFYSKLAFTLSFMMFSSVVYLRYSIREYTSPAPAVRGGNGR
jgi:hypothetical protein